jgi:hypothetical protein
LRRVDRWSALAKRGDSGMAVSVLSQGSSDGTFSALLGWEDWQNAIGGGQMRRLSGSLLGTAVGIVAVVIALVAVGV